MKLNRKFQKWVAAVQQTMINNYIQILILSVLVMFIALFFRQGNTLQYTYKVDDIAREPIIAPFNFPILKTEEKLKTDLDNELISEPFIFRRNQEKVEIQSNKLNEYFALIRKIRNASSQLEKTKELLYRYRHDEKFGEVNSMYQTDSVTLDILQKQYKTIYPALAVDKKRSALLMIQYPFETDKTVNQFLEELLQICRNRWAEGIMDIEFSAVISREISLDQGDIPIIMRAEELNDLNAAWTRSKIEINSLFPNEADIHRDLGYTILVEFMKPNIIFDKETTERRQQTRLDRVPRHQGIMLKDEMIVDANQRITPDIFQKLSSLSLAISKQNYTIKGWNLIVSFLGRLMIVAIIISFFFTFLLTYRNYIYNEWKYVLLIALIFAIMITLTDLFVNRFQLSAYLIPITVAAMLLTILFDARIGFMGTVSVALLSGILIGNDLEFIITVIFISSVAMYMVRRLRTRSQFLSAILVMFVASGLAVFAHGLYKGHSMTEMQVDLIYLSVTSLLTPLITYGLVGIIEITFGITTDLTLLELLDYNHPILKRLQKEANGTFNHSIIVGNLAEAGADAIGARSLLCRVGAYYHDIGKMIHPEYFIENQWNADNKHDGLTEAMSAKIIRNHVAEGVKLADEFGLPQIVSDFIPMHHGTTRVEYFYQKALEKNNGKKIDAQAFTYPGPKPNSKETGILMLCESIEAAVRSLKNPDVFKIEEMIDRIIKKRLDEGQLDECPLTFDDLRKIKGEVDGQTGMLPVLRGIYHIRIEYPENKKSDTKVKSS